MNLHRTGAEGQWASIPQEDQNTFQKIASKTAGIITPGNTVSAIGATLVTSGLLDVKRGESTKGILKIGFGRLADIGDGMAAEATGTKSPLGEAVDVVVDKSETIAALPILVKSGVLPKNAGATILGLNGASTILGTLAKKRGITLHPSKEGKLAMAGQWGAIGFYGLSEIAENSDAPKLSRGLEIAGHISIVATAALGAKAIIGYTQEALGPVDDEQVAPSRNSSR